MPRRRNRPERHGARSAQGLHTPGAMKLLVGACLLVTACAADDMPAPIGEDTLAGRYDGGFECTNFDADVARLTIFDDEQSGELRFTPSNGAGDVVGLLTNLASTADVLTFDVAFDATARDVAGLRLQFTLDRYLGGFEGRGTLEREGGRPERCTATFGR